MRGNKWERKEGECWRGSERGELGKEVFGNALGAGGYGLETRRRSAFFLAVYTCHPDRSASRSLLVVTDQHQKGTSYLRWLRLVFLAYPVCREQQTFQRDDAREELPIAKDGMSGSLHF